jgi:DNA-binding GntR family transcriptional regulator
MTSSIADSLRVKIEHEILMFNFKPGDRLDECRLADRYGSSRTPVREALRLLASDGLVRIRPHRGAVVSGLSIAELMEMFEMMGIYEGVCARLATQHATQSEMEEIEAAHDECRTLSESDDQSEYFPANVRFHEAIYRASHNRYLIKRTIATRNRLGAYCRLQLRRENRLKDSFAEHDAVVNAIRNGLPEEADRKMRDHMAIQTANVSSIISSLPQEYLAENQKPPVQTVVLRDGRDAYPDAALAFE